MKLIKIPRINALGKGGCEKAPDLVVEELKKQLGSKKVFGVDGISVNNEDIEESEKVIYESCVELFKGLSVPPAHPNKGERIAFIGGDHSISYPILKAFGEIKGFDKSFLIVFDAHADCDNVTANPTHEEWLRGLIEQGWKPENVVLVGVRKMWDVEKKFLRGKGVKVFSSECNLEGAADYLTEKAQGKAVYVSIDIDVLDPAFAPGVNYPEPLGFSSKEFFYLLRRVFHVPGLRAIDVVEVVPQIDEKYGFRTVKIVAKILQEFLESRKKLV